jgi:hypothetical protein
MGTSFAADIAPMLAPYREEMLWRFDLADYEAVKANAAVIYSRLTGVSGNTMPPAPVPPLSAAHISDFKSWMEDTCPP